MYLKKISILVFLVIPFLACNRYYTGEVDPLVPVNCWVVKISVDQLIKWRSLSKFKYVILAQNRPSQNECSIASRKWQDIYGTTRSIKNVVERHNNTTVPLIFESTAEYRFDDTLLKALVSTNGIHHIRLTPEPFEEKKEYIAYDLTVHNARGEKISNVSRKVNPCPPCRD